MSELYFYKGSENLIDEDKEEIDSLKSIQNELAKVFDTKSLSFLLGSGCSSFNLEGKEVGIPTMKPMANEFYNSSRGGYSLTADQIKYIKDDLCINIEEESFKNNIERFLETLHSYNFYLKRADIPKGKTTDANIHYKHIDDDKREIPQLINQTRLFILKKCLNEDNKGMDNAGNTD